jgi:hypothetical protein
MLLGGGVRMVMRRAFEKVGSEVLNCMNTRLCISWPWQGSATVRYLTTRLRNVLSADLRFSARQ